MASTVEELIPRRTLCELRIFVHFDSTVFAFELPRVIKFLHVWNLDEKVFVNYEADTRFERSERWEFRLYPDQAEIHSEDWFYVGTINPNSFCFHLYARRVIYADLTT